MRFGRFALRALLALAALGIGDRLLDRFALADGWFLGRAIAPFDPPLFSPSQRAALERIEKDLARGRGREGKFDPELGWCNKPDSGFGEFRYDWAGARIGVAPLERQKQSGVRRVVAVGCSMTHGEEVGAKESWCARLDELSPALEMANLGVAAYGIDQALMRLRRDGWALAPDEVWLGILPQAALRVTTHFRPLLDHWSLDVAFKPNFVVGAGDELELDPNPAASLADVPRLLHDQRAFLAVVADRDPWIRRARLAFAPRGSSWTHGSFAARLLLTAAERGGRDCSTCFDERSEFGRLYTTIVRAMARECTQHGVPLRVIFLPGESDLESRSEDGRGYWEDWGARRRGEGMEVFDLSPVLSGAKQEGRQLFQPLGHYTPAGNELVAHALIEELSRSSPGK